MRNQNIALYGGGGWHGEPWCPGGVLDTDAVTKTARWPLVTIGPDFWNRNDLIDAFEQANPQIRLIGKFTLPVYFNPDHSIDPAHNVMGKIKAALDAIPDQRGYLWSSVYGDWFNPLYASSDPRPNPGHWSWFNFNAACQDAVDAVVQAVAEAFNPRLQGVFIDIVWARLRWASEGTNKDHIDLARAGGFTDLDAFDVAYRAGLRSLVRQFRAMWDMDAHGWFAGDGLILNNGGYPDPLVDAYANGTMREGFPNQSGGTWASNLFGDANQRGAIADATLMRQPSCCFLNMQPPVVRPDGSWDAADPENARAIRFGLGSAMLAGNYFAMSTNSTPPTDRPFECWAKEYELGFGQPLSPASATAPYPLYAREFQSGRVVVNPGDVPISTVRVTVPALDAVFVPR